MRHSLFLLLCCFTLSCGSQAQDIDGVVTGIADGDTLYVLDANRENHKIRLLGIDAPESGQAFGERSKQSLAEMTYRQTVSVDWQSRDAYGRILGKVRTASANCHHPNCPMNRDVNLAQVRLGLAWWNKKFADTQFPGDARLYEDAEKQARATRKGLWSDPHAVPPWTWRRQHPRRN